MKVKKTTQEFDKNVTTIISLKECLMDTEKTGYWEKGTVEKMLKDGQVIFTPFALYKKKRRR